MRGLENSHKPSHSHHSFSPVNGRLLKTGANCFNANDIPNASDMTVSEEGQGSPQGCKIVAGG